ncbi:hypothetical protein CMV_026353 [Castanea mollissima]|uniref:Uncharacterized protein n=1 Tax=Castanea mollissima TaxID=60419 RepID=A0A8J4QBC0_9ROSI|nr:hypothetical protein CMV_026353 [Castanea mollissima]
MPQFSALRSVPNLKSIPSGLQHVTALRKLEISDCPNLTIFPELTSVVYLEISDSPNLTSIPDGISNLTSLEELRISHCPNLKSLPDEMVSLKSLQKLSIDGCPDLAKRCEKEIGEDCPFFSQFLLGYLKNTSPLSLDHATCNITSDLMGLIIEIYSLETLRISETDLAQNIGRLGI